MRLQERTACRSSTDNSTDRQRRKNENIAKEVFGKARRASAPGVVANKRKPGVVPSLASRIGVTGAGVAKVCWTGPVVEDLVADKPDSGASRLQRDLPGLLLDQLEM